MKRFSFFIAAFLLIASVVYILVDQPEQTDPLDLIAADSLVVVDWKSPLEIFQRLAGTSLGRAIGKLDLPLLSQAMGLNERQMAAFFSERVASWKAVMEHPLFRRLFKRRTVLALLAGDNLTEDALTRLFSSFVVINTAGEELRHLRSLTDKSNGALLLPTHSYKGFTIRGYRLNNGLPWYFATEGDLLIMAFDPAPIQQCLDRLLAKIIRPQFGIRKNPVFHELRERAQGKEDLFLYVNMVGFKRSLLKTDQQPDREGLSVTPESFTSGVLQMACFHQYRKKTEQWTSIVRFDPNTLRFFQKNIYLRSPVKNKKLSTMPANILVYFWSNWLDLSAWWKATCANADHEERKRADRLAALTQKYTGMGIDDFFQLFGHQVGFNVKEIKTSDFFPVPRICFCIEMAQPKKIKALMEKFIAGLPVGRDKVDRTEVVSILAAGGLMQPSYAFIGNFLVIADGKDQLMDILQNQGDMLSQDPDFLAVDMGLRDENNLVVFARIAQIVPGLKELVSSIGTFIAIRNEQAGARSKILIDQGLLPLLDSLKLIKAESVRSYTTEGELVLHAKVLKAVE